ncbi:copper-binding protein [Alkalimarinus coralli]|uniref:copper-binding protein n=1 Tax=Alkalimarinus coralli TaxID=2935863 RepID=UPI00202ADDE3|nr:copper-binding protein [Alkalimarinus coralli]
MKNLLNRTSSNRVIATLIFSAMLLPAAGWADANRGHNKNHMNEKGQMMNQAEMGQHMREVMGTGRINKVMADRKMVNIVHEPIAELDWPKMRMNFRTAQEVNLGELKPGQEVTFKLQVNKDNSYVIKQIDVK